MENVDELIEQYRQEAAQFTLSPRPAVWQHIDAEINPPRRKRRFLFIWWLLGCLAAYGFYALGTRYIVHSTFAHQQSKPQPATHITQPATIVATTTQTKEENKTNKKQKKAKRNTTAITIGITGTQATKPAYTDILKKETIRPSIASTPKAMATNKPTLPVAAPVAVQAVWPYPIHRLVVSQPAVPVPVIKPHHPPAVGVPAITVVPLGMLAANGVKKMAAGPTVWKLPVRGVVPEIMYPATAALPHMPAQLLPYATRMASPGSVTLPLLAAPKQYLQPMAVLHTPLLLPVPNHPLRTAAMIANVPNPPSFARLIDLPAYTKPMMAKPQIVQTLPLVGVGKTMGIPLQNLATAAPAHLPTPLPQSGHAPMLPLAAVYTHATAARMAPAPHRALPITHNWQQNVAAQHKGWVLQASLPARAAQAAFGPTFYPTIQTADEEPDATAIAEFAHKQTTQHSAGNFSYLSVAPLVLLATGVKPDKPELRKMAKAACTVADTAPHKPTARRWAIEMTGGPSANKHTITEAGQYQFIRSYRDSTDAAIRTMHWSLGLRYAINNRVSLLLNGALLQTGEEMASRQRVYGTDTVLVNISSMGPTASFHKVIIAEKNFDIGGDSTGRIRNKVTYASVGVGIRYHLLTTGKLSMGMQPSVSLAWRTGARMHTYDSTVQEWRVATKNEVVSRNTIAGFGLYAEYRISPSVSVSVMPHYTRYMGPVFRQSPVAVQYSQTSLLTTVTLWLP